MTDIVVLLLSILFLVRGASRGFMRSLFGPFSMIVATLMSIIYYQITKNIIVSLIIGLVGPFLLHLLLRIIFSEITASESFNKKPRAMSQLAGALLTFCWGWVFIAITLILLTFIPPLTGFLETIQKNVSQSYSYHFVKPLQDRFFPPPKQNKVEEVENENTNVLSEAQSLAQDPHFQKMIQDPEIKQEMENRDIAALMKRPQVLDFAQQVMSNPALMKKVMDIYKHQKAETNSQ
ncbi:MAG: CvpA family protein [Candidatus Omnitrophica bacterium]|nr:CvpA family protein [Candidatus Omnitrophota bacterium]